MGKNSHARKKAQHKKALEKIVESPESIGVTDVIYGEIEVPYQHKGMEVETDIILITKNEFYVVEYKNQDTDVGRNKAKRQLERAKQSLRINEKGPTKLYCVVGNPPKVIELLGKHWKTNYETP